LHKISVQPVLLSRRLWEEGDLLKPQTEFRVELKISDQPKNFAKFEFRIFHRKVGFLQYPENTTSNPILCFSGKVVFLLKNQHNIFMSKKHEK
jgi:hypothetical protein